MSILQLTIAGGGLIVFTAAIRALAVHRLPKTTFLILWIVAALRFLLPISIPLPVPIPMASALTAGKLQIASAGSMAGATAGETAFPFAAGMTALWLTGMVSAALYFSVSYLRSLQRFRMSLPDRTSCVQEWLAAHRIRRPLEVRTSDQISSPLTYGILRPVILLPKQLDRRDGAVLQYVLAHEYVHIRRFDAVTKLLFAAVLCVHWFNPLAWVMYVLANRDLELSCDACVLHMSGRAERARYALSLLDLEETRSRCTPFCNHFSKNAIEERIEAIMKFKQASTAAIASALVLVVGATTAFAASTPAADADGQALSDLPKAAAILTEDGCIDIGRYEKTEQDPAGGSDMAVYIERIENGAYLARYSLDELPPETSITVGIDDCSGSKAVMQEVLSDTAKTVNQAELPLISVSRGDESKFSPEQWAEILMQIEQGVLSWEV